MKMMMMKALFSRLAAGVLAATAVSACAAQAQVLDQLVIEPRPIDGIVPGELSGLAWDADERLLYAVSDRGVLYRFELVLDGNRLRSVKPVHALRLDAGGGAAPNAEGLSLIDGNNGKRGDTQLVIALENGPRIVRYTPQGRMLGDATLPLPLRDRSAYRSSNSGLEAVTVHPRHGVITAPQRSLSSLPERVHRVYAADGSQWTVPALDRGAVKALETLADGSLLMLERHGKGKHIVPALRRIDPAACAGDGECRAEPVPLDGLEPGDNYEGLARLTDRLFVMVSDDGGNGKRATRLVLFSFDAP